MSMTHLSTRQLYDAILLGCQQLIRGGAYLNQINVYPVADGDTGNNMASTANAILTFSSEQAFIDETLQSVADASVIGAHGNSGIIFSQFFNGLAEGAIRQQHISIDDFSRLLLQAAKRVRQAIAVPIEGTILTLIEAWANIFHSMTARIDNFHDLMNDLLPILEETVQSTAETLPALKNANVVDAGALGFYYFVNGFSDSLHHVDHSPRALTQVNHIPVQHMMPTMAERPEYRYCTEAVFHSDKLDSEQLQAILEQNGDSVVLTGNERIRRFHVHTNKPSHLFTHLIQQGRIQYPKIDDMTRQYEMLHQRQNDIALVTDSSADIPMHWHDKYQIHQLLLNIHLDDCDLLDRHCLDSKHIYPIVSKLSTHPQTSSPAPAFLQEKLGVLSSHYKHVLVLSISREMSSTFDMIMHASAMYSNIKVINTKTTSGGHGLLLAYTAEMIASYMNFDSICHALNAAIESTYIFVMVDDLSCMIRSGRVSKLTGRLGQVTGIKPIISLDENGQGVVYDKAFTTASGLRRLISIVQKKTQSSGKTLAQYCIVHAGVEEKAMEFSELTTKAFEQSPAYIEHVSPVIGFHAGQGCIGLAVRLIDA